MISKLDCSSDCLEVVVGVLGSLHQIVRWVVDQHHYSLHLLGRVIWTGVSHVVEHFVVLEKHTFALVKDSWFTELLVAFKVTEEGIFGTSNVLALDTEKHCSISAIRVDTLASD